jgi:hypothetical protein
LVISKLISYKKLTWCQEDREFNYFYKKYKPSSQNIFVNVKNMLFAQINYSKSILKSLEKMLKLLVFNLIYHVFLIKIKLYCTVIKFNSIKIKET